MGLSLQSRQTEQSAARLLTSYIGEEAYARFRHEGGIFILPPKRCPYHFWKPEIYLVLKSMELHHTYASIYKKYSFDRKGYFRRGCVIIAGEHLPKDDMVLAFYLAIKTDVKNFNRTLNWYDPMRIEKDLDRFPTV